MSKNNFQFSIFNLKFQRGFTLLELLIVIAIIGVLVSIGTVSYSGAQKKSRDAKRQGDMKAIQNAFEQYYADNNGNYPSTCTISAAYLPGGIPVDPKTVASYATTYGANCALTSYCFCAALEGGTGSQSTDCAGGSIPSGYRGFFCARSLQ